jgi:hypothetical protein
MLNKDDDDYRRRNDNRGRQVEEETMMDNKALWHQERAAEGRILHVQYKMNKKNVCMQIIIRMMASRAAAVGYFISDNKNNKSEEKKNDKFYAQNLSTTKHSTIRQGKAKAAVISKQKYSNRVQQCVKIITKSKAAQKTAANQPYHRHRMVDLLLVETNRMIYV